MQNLDLTKHRLIYDGPLTMKLGDTKRFKTIDLHVVLLEDCIMLLQKQDDKYLLKFHTTTFGTTGAPQGQKFCHSPVIKFSTMLVRPVATGIYVIFYLFIIPIIFTLFSPPENHYTLKLNCLKKKHVMSLKRFITQFSRKAFWKEDFIFYIQCRKTWYKWKFVL